MEFDRFPMFELTDKIYRQLVTIDDHLSKLSIEKGKRIRVILRKTSKIRSINSSLAIEGNEMPLSKTIDMIDGKAVQGPFDEIVETKNAIEAYSRIGSFDVSSVKDFIDIHDVMTFGTIEKPGFREEGVGVYDGDTLIYKAPNHEQVPDLIERLFSWYSSSKSPMVVKSAVIHYYIEAIHPFIDGNGRMGRLWQNAILREYDSGFMMVSIEYSIRNKQKEYYEVLERCQKASDCTEFVEFSNDAVISSLESLLKLEDKKISALMSAMGSGSMSSSEIMDAMGISNKSYFLKNYIRPAIECGLIMMSDPEHPRSSGQKYRKTIV
jgi:Fic family protein